MLRMKHPGCPLHGLLQDAARGMQVVKAQDLRDVNVRSQLFKIRGQGGIPFMPRHVHSSVLAQETTSWLNSVSIFLQALRRLMMSCPSGLKDQTAGEAIGQPRRMIPSSIDSSTVKTGSGVKVGAGLSASWVKAGRAPSGLSVGSGVGAGVVVRVVCS